MLSTLCQGQQDLGGSNGLQGKEPVHGGYSDLGGGASMGLAITTQTSTDLLGSDKISPSHFGYSGMCASLDKDFSEPYLFL